MIWEKIACLELSQTSMVKHDYNWHWILDKDLLITTALLLLFLPPTPTPATLIYELLLIFTKWFMNHPIRTEMNKNEPIKKK